MVRAAGNLTVAEQLLVQGTGAGLVTSSYELVGNLVSSTIPLAAPTITAVTTTGTAGTTAYGYRVVAVNNAGVSAPSIEVTIATGNAALTTTNYNVISWAAVAGALQYYVYGRVAGAESLIGVTSTASYADQSMVTAGPAAGYNMLANASLNQNTATWLTTQVTLARDTTLAPPLPGVTAGLVTTTASTGGFNVQTGNGTRKQLTNVAASTTYTASAYIYLGTVANATIGLQWFDASGTLISGVNGTAPTGVTGVTGSWQRLTVSQLLPSTAVLANVYVAFGANGTGQTAWVAAPQLDIGTAALPYCFEVPLGTGLVYEGVNRVYSAANPPPSTGSATATATTFAGVAKFGAFS
jgi:hypothetical protein